MSSNLAPVKGLRVRVMGVATGRITAGLVCLLAVVVSSCMAGPGRKSEDVTLADGTILKVINVDVETLEGKTTAYLTYKTSVSTEDCLASQAEVRRVWAVYFKDEAERQNADEAFIFPEFTERGTPRNLIFSYAREGKGPWSEGGYLLISCKPR